MKRLHRARTLQTTSLWGTLLLTSGCLDPLVEDPGYAEDPQSDFGVGSPEGPRNNPPGDGPAGPGSPATGQPALPGGATGALPPPTTTPSPQEADVTEDVSEESKDATIDDAAAPSTEPSDPDAGGPDTIEPGQESVSPLGADAG